jgi:hypothetical protein
LRGKKAKALRAVLRKMREAGMVAEGRGGAGSLVRFIKRQHLSPQSAPWKGERDGGMVVGVALEEPAA